jgi:hypothetical protein
LLNFLKKAPFSNIPKELRPILNVAFPKGETQLENEAKALLSTYPDLFTFESARGLVVWTKSHSLTNSSLSLNEMCDAIGRHENGRLTKAQCSEIYTKILTQDLLSREG